MMKYLKDLFFSLCFFGCLVSWSCAIAAFVPSLSPTGRTGSIHASSTTALEAQQKTAIVAGATGYIGKSVVRESVRQGYKTYALVRDRKEATGERFDEFFQGAEIVECDVTDTEQVSDAVKNIRDGTSDKNSIDVMVSCLASRSGVKKDAYLIDYKATLNCLRAGQMCDAGHFVLLSAFCVRNPLLQFQHAKLKFEAELKRQNDMTYSIVRPTAFFKSVSGQLDVVQGGAPFIVFGGGEDTRCNPIAESDLAKYLMDCVVDKSRHNKVINLGGPDKPISKQEQGEMLFNAVGMEPKYFYVPMWILDTIINTLQFLADVTRSESLEDAAESGRIVKYYAVEDMLTTDPSEKYGTVPLRQHYERIAAEGQEYDPYVSIFSKRRDGEPEDLRVAMANVTGR